MTLGETIALCSLCVFSLSFLFSFSTFIRSSRQGRHAQASRLHEVWWGSDMMEVRDKVFALCRDHAHGGRAAAEVIAYYASPLELLEPPGRAAFSKLLGFFSNLEVCIAAGLVDEGLATRLFGEAHYVDYQPFIGAVREALGRRVGSALPSWLLITVQLERRFERHGVKWRVLSTARVTPETAA